MYSTSRIEFLVTRPISRIMPIWLYTLMRRPGQLEREQRAGHRERHGQQHGERVHQRLELAGQHHEHHHQRQQEREVERRAALLQLARLAGQGGAAAAGQHLARDPVERVERLAQGEAGRQARP